MPSVVHYKFRTDRRWSTIPFEGASISVLELKRAIVRNEHMERSVQDFDLLLHNKATGEGVRAPSDRGKVRTELRDETAEVPTGTSVVIQRVPATRNQFLRISAPPRQAAYEAPVKDDGSGSSVHDAETDGE